jgi:hypothetical protein
MPQQTRTAPPSCRMLGCSPSTTAASSSAAAGCRSSSSDETAAGSGQARRYRQTAMGVKIANSSADQARATTTSLLAPRISERTALTMGVIG